MRRFESTHSLWLRTPAGASLEMWVAESVRVRLIGLAGLAGLPPSRGLLLPRCRSVHTAGMRFRVDVAFISWPPVAGACEAVAVALAVPPFRVVSAHLRARGVAAVEAGAGSLGMIGVRAGAQLSIYSAEAVERARVGVKNF